MPFKDGGWLPPRIVAAMQEENKRRQELDPCCDHTPVPPPANTTFAADTTMIVALNEYERLKRLRKWDLFFLGMADYTATASKDPSTKVGAVIARPDRTIASVGFNGFARSMCDDDELYADREVKYARIIHGEMNAIVNAHGPVKDCTLYTVPFAPCERCAGILIQSGIQRVVAPVLPDHLKERWGESLRRAGDFFHEAGVCFDLIDRD